MAQENGKARIADDKASELDPAKVGGGTDCVSTDNEMNMTPLYDALVDATSAAIERVMTAAKAL